jgi:hypothetical protein
MTHRLRSLATLALVTVALSRANAWAQSYGLGDQILTISADEFQPYQANNTTFDHGWDGYLQGPGSYVAAIHLPDGAQITQICMDAYITNAAGAQFGAQTRGVSIAPGVDPTLYEWAGAETGFNNGYGSACTETLAYTIRSVFDLGDGLKSYRHRILASILDPSGKIAGVRITWHRQVSSPPASSSFGDVSSSDGAFQFIEALVASGVTAGCGGGNYCPDAPLTRRQMAVFLSKALGLHWPN